MTPIWRAPKVREFGAADIVEYDEHELRQKIARDYRSQWEVDEKWWANLHEVHQINYEGQGDPELGFECFNDFTYSPELRNKMRAQVELEVFSLPDEEIPELYGGHWRKKNVHWKKRKIRNNKKDF